MTLTLADLENVTPFYICNTTVNSWRRTPKDKESFELLALTPREIRRLDSPYEEDAFLDKLEPEDIILSEAMAMSAAALTPRMGKMGGTDEDFSTDLKIILGVAMGASILSDPRKERRKNMFFQVSERKFCPLRPNQVIAFKQCDEKSCTSHVTRIFVVQFYTTEYTYILDF